jgi:hypothetical protein
LSGSTRGEWVAPQSVALSPTLPRDVFQNFSQTQKPRRKPSIKGQAFNSLNRANFNLPELYADGPGTFGKIFSAQAPRQIQFAARFRF